MNDVALRLSGITKSFGRIKALDHVSLDVPPRSVFGLLGPNGAGKTTLFSLAAGYIKPDAGSIEALGADIRRSSHLHGRLGILPQDALFQPNVPIIEQLVFFRLLDGSSRRVAEEEVTLTLQKVGLDEYHKRGVHSLSHGMIQRLGIAQAFLGEPELILLDEPTAGLDPQNARQIRDLIQDLRTRATIIISSHNLAEVQELCDHVAILDEGRLVATGSMADIARRGRELDLALSRELTDAERETIEALEVVSRLSSTRPGRYAASLNLAAEAANSDDAIRDVLQALLDMGVTPRQVSEGNSLEAHFLKLTARGKDEKSSQESREAPGWASPRRTV